MMQFFYIMLKYVEEEKFMHNILVLAPLKEENFKKIEKTFPQLDFAYASYKTVTQAMIDWADVIVGNPGLQVDLNKAHLKAVLLHSAGSDEYVKEGRLHPSTYLTNASGTYGKAIAEHTIGMILSLNKNLLLYSKQQREHLWKFSKQGKELYNSTVLVVGLGNLGYEIAKRLKAFDCHIIGVKRTQSEKPKCVDELYTQESLDALLPQADFVILTLPQTSKTKHLLNKRRLLLMKEDAVLVNVGRGSAICTRDLKAVLDQGHLYAVGLDVFEEEPYPKEDKLWDYDNVLMTPHASGGYIWESTRMYYTDLVIRNIKHLLRNEDLENEVDFQTGYRKHVNYKDI